MSFISQASSINLNKVQNDPKFKLEPLEAQPLIFRKGLFSKTLDDPKDNPEVLENYRTVTVKCLFQGCS